MENFEILNFGCNVRSLKMEDLTQTKQAIYKGFSFK